MFYAKQFKSLLDAVKQLDPDAEVVPSLLRITFTLPNVGKCVLQYDHQGFDKAYDAVGTVKLSYGDRTTEFDSLQNALDGVEGLSRMKEFNRDSDAPVNESVDDQPKEMTEDGVKKVIGSLGLDISNIWYDGNKNRPVFDCKTPDGKTICVWNEPPYEAKVWMKDSDPRDNGLAEDIVSLDELKTKLSSLAGVQPTENADESAMYTFDDSSDNPNDFIIELESKKGWTSDTADTLAD